MNKYQSNVRTYIARNLVWDYASASHALLHNMNAPANIQLVPNDFVKQFYYANWPSGRNWLTTGNLNIRRVGLFSNFADGLVMENTWNRLVLTIYSAKTTLTTVAGTAAFTEASSLITGTNLNALGDVIADTNVQWNSNLYWLYNVAGNGLSARLSDFSYRTINLTSLNGMSFSGTHAYPAVVLPALNTMFDAEIFFDGSVATNKQAVENTLLWAKIDALPSDQSPNLYTNVIDTGFNTKPVSFDSVIEVEITPY